jgi:hypothetical protein
MAVRTHARPPQADGPLVLNLFRRRQQPDLFCAVPINQSVPMFLSDGTWMYVSSLDPEKPRPRGFCPLEAREYCRSDGYYVFYTSQDGPNALRSIS